MIRRLQSTEPDGRFAPAAWLPPELLGELRQAQGFEARGWSMYPALRRGDRLELAAPRSPVPGDLVVFWDDGHYACHRVASVDAGGAVRATSDSGLRDEHVVPRDAIIGIVGAVVRRGRRFEPARAPQPLTWADRLWIRIGRRAESLWATARRARSGTGR